MREIIEHAKEIGTFLAELFIAFHFFKKYLDQKLAKPDVAKSMPKQNDLDVALINKMEEVKEQLNADRVHVYEFHNGDKLAKSRSAFRFTCTYEVIKSGTKPLRKHLEKISISLLPYFIKELREKHKFVCDDIEKIKETYPSTYGFKKALGIQSFYDVAVTDLDGDVIGFIAVQWDDKNKMCINKELIEQLKRYVERHLVESIEM